jgi:hypothetical protein
MAKQRPPLPLEEALRRVVQITPLLAKDTWYALRARAVLHTANEIVCERDIDGPRRFGDTYNIVQNSLALTVALAVARLFDVSKNFPVEEQDKASIPVLANLLMRGDVQEALAEKGRGWLSGLHRGAELGESDCRRAIATVLSLYDAHANSSYHQEALARLRDFRTGRLAHHLFDQVPTDLPRFDDLDLLANCARDVVRSAVLAVEGKDRDLGHEEERKRRLDRQFWDIGLSATFAAED